MILTKGVWTSMDQKKSSIGSVFSKDGTSIGYRQLGSGPGLILVHGGMMASQNFMKLAGALSGEFTVYVPDRRGRGLSGPHGNGYSLARECEDMQALVDQTGAQNIFGLSSGAIVVLQSALRLPGSLRRVALYEPPLLLNDPTPIAWVPRFDAEIAKGKLAAAMLTVMKGTGDASWLTVLPRFVLVPLLERAIEGQAHRGWDDEVPLKTLIPTMHFDAQLVRETKGQLESFRALQAEVLLLGGNQSRRFLKAALDALSVTLPHVKRVEFPDVGHLAADNGGQPERVAKELQRFFVDH
jgi:pimeloyl-ACP methyl ester carboxylesterase